MELQRYFEEKLRQVDRRDQRRARDVLTRLASGRVSSDDLLLVTTTKRLVRKPLGEVTINDLVAMGIVKVRESEEAR